MNVADTVEGQQVWYFHEPGKVLRLVQRMSGSYFKSIRLVHLAPYRDYKGGGDWMQPHRPEQIKVIHEDEVQALIRHAKEQTT